MNPFELHHERNPGTEVINIIKENNRCLSDRTTVSFSVPQKQIPIYVARNEKGEVADHIIMARKRKTPFCASHPSQKRRPVKSVSENFYHPYTFFECVSPEGIFGREIQRTTENCRRRYRTHGLYWKQYNFPSKININTD